MRPHAVLLVCLLLAASRAEAQFAAADPAPGEQFNLEVSANFWKPTPELRLNTGGLQSLGIGEVDLAEEFGIENKRFTEYRVTTKAGRKHKFRLSSVNINYDESAVLSRTVRFGNLTIPVSAAATADIEWKLKTYAYEWDFVAGDRGYLGVIAALKDNDVSAELSATGYGTEIAEARASIPAFGLSGRGYPHRLFSITGEFTYFKVPERFRDRLEGKYFDLDIYGTFSFGRNVAVQGGYKRVHVDYIADDDTGYLRMKGLYWGGVLRF
jgi:hypothetical protein